GAYARGSDSETDVAVDYHLRLMELLQQGRGETEAFERGRDRLVRIAIETGEKLRVRLAQREAQAKAWTQRAQRDGRNAEEELGLPCARPGADRSSSGRRPRTTVAGSGAQPRRGVERHPRKAASMRVRP